MTDERQKIVDRVRKLMKLSADGSASEGEVENAMKFARKLMDQYGVSEDEALASESTDAASARVVQDEAARWKNKVYVWDQWLSRAVAYVCDCQSYVKTTAHPDDLRDVKHVMFVGMERDVAVAKALFTELRVTARTMAKYRTGSSNNAAFCNYMKGFAQRLVERARQMKQASANGQGGVEGSTAVVLAKDAAVKKWVGDNLRLKCTKSRARIGDAASHSRGRDDANNVDLGTKGAGSGGGGRRRLR